ncbi:hypothetical protein BH23ACT9_BH23ACT9_34200 [soil metagenome]
MASQTLDDYGDLLTPAEAGAVMRRGRRQIYEDVRLGRIPAIRLGTSIRTPKQGLRRLLDQAATEAAA